MLDAAKWQSLAFAVRIVLNNLQNLVLPKTRAQKPHASENLCVSRNLTFSGGLCGAVAKDIETRVVIFVSDCA